MKIFAIFMFFVLAFILVNFLTKSVLEPIVKRNNYIVNSYYSEEDQRPVVVFEEK